MPDPHETTTYVGEPIEVAWDKPPMLSKRPSCPDRFTWDGTTIGVTDLLEEWRDYRRRGKMASNMRPAHAARAKIKGSRGVGRFYFRVLGEDGRIYDLYFDRAGKDGARGRGIWFLDRVSDPNPD